ncbi:MAG: ferredoxin--NADP reductase [Acidimicrobiales bacterium]
MTPQSPDANIWPDRPGPFEDAGAAADSPEDPSGGDGAARSVSFEGADLDVEGPRGEFPLSRGAPERRLRIVDHYRRRAEVTSVERLTDTGTVRLWFRVVDDEVFEYEPGRFIGISAVVDGIRRRTPYCLASPNRPDGTFALLVRLVPDGPLSRYLGALGPGDRISFRGPLGRSMLPRNDSDELILVATGVGVSPMLALVRHLADAGSSQPVRMFWGLRLPEDICLTDQLEALVADHARFSYQISLSQPPPGWNGLRGRVTESVPPLIEALGSKRFYLVGNGEMIEEMAGALSDLGVDRTDIYCEAFFNGGRVPDPLTLAQVRNRFVAHDLFSPHTTDYSMLQVERPLNRR